MSEVSSPINKLKKFVFERGFSLFGIADTSGIKKTFLLERNTVEKFDRGIVLGKKLLDPVLEEIRDKPTPLYFHHYRQANFFLDRGAFLLASYLQDEGFRALPVPASQVLDWKNQKGHLSHKEVGRLAGLGWKGRNNLLVNPDLGARFRIVTVLTDANLKPGEPTKDTCGQCRICVPECPAQAIHDSPEDFDHQACFEKLKEFRNKGLVGQYICGVCVRACAPRIR